MSNDVSNSLKWKRRIGIPFSLLQSKGAARRAILIYHSVGGGPMATDAARFREQMAWLAEHTEVVSLDALLAGDATGGAKIRVALTFDDGYRSVHDTAAPILAEYGFLATVYLNSGHIRDGEHEASDAEQGHYPDEQFMCWDEVLKLQDKGWGIGSHGVEHLDLTLQPDEVVMRELADSRAEIEQHTGIACKHFSYTWGHHNETVRHAVAAAGYCTAVAGEHRPLGIGDQRFELPRLDIRREYNIDDFIAVASGDWDYLGFYQSAKGLYRGGLFK